MLEEIVIAGFGGQGVLSLGEFVAEAGIVEGKNVTWIPTYGQEKRGGDANSAVVITDDEVVSPIVENPTALLCMNEKSILMFGESVVPGGLMLYNSSMASTYKGRTDITTFAIPCNELAKAIGNELSANMILLGAFLEYSKCLKPESVISAMRGKMGNKKESILTANTAALKAGAEFLKRLKGENKMKVAISERMKGVNASITRETMKITAIPDMINFAGGMPYADLFPIEALRVATNKVFEKDGKTALQYSTTEGYLPLREHIAKLMAKESVKCDADDILIVSGSQQGLEFTAKLFLNPGDTVICESPSYVAGLNAYRSYQANFVEVQADDDGMVMEDLKQKLENTPNAKYIYVIPNFQNPTGKTWSLERRKEVLKLAEQYNIPIVEDNPYGDLRYDGEKILPIKAFDTQGLVIYMGTFSKTICPSFRVGWIIANPDILIKYNQIKQSADLQTSTFNQRIISNYLDDNDLDAQISVLVDAYRFRRDTMLNAIKNEFPDGIKYTHPDGGMFIWVEMPDYIDTDVLRSKGIDAKVAVLSGETFFPQSKVKNTFRMSFTAVDPETIQEGIHRLAGIIKEMMDRH